ncbi:MAG: metallophosphoesterase [Bacteroidales bacterium]|nr:metallophosphoesterase [Bacteroidales bacterium]
MINILHLSDLHLSSQHNIRREEVLSGLLVGVKSFLKKNREWQPDCLVISGDITFSGSKADYIEAKKFLGKIEKELRIDYINMFLAVGNHDKLRWCFDKRLYEEHKEFNWSKTLEEQFINNRKRVKDFLSNNSKRDLLFGGYNSFVSDLNQLPRSEKIPKWSSGNDRTQGVFIKNNIIFVTINSAFYSISGKKDYGKLELDNDFIIKVKEYLELINKDRSKIVISILHHNPSWFIEEAKLLRTNELSIHNEIVYFSNLILSGHEHNVKLNPDFLNCTTHIVSGGATYTEPDDGKSFYCNNFSIIQIDEKNRAFKRMAFTYLNNGKPETAWKYDECDSMPINPLNSLHNKFLNSKNLERENIRLKNRVFKRDFDKWYGEDGKRELFKVKINFKDDMETQNAELIYKLLGIRVSKEEEVSNLDERFFVYDKKILLKCIDSKNLIFIEKLPFIFQKKKLDDKKMILIIIKKNNESNIVISQKISNIVKHDNLQIIRVNVEPS